jgi:hypothetical protein
MNHEDYNTKRMSERKLDGAAKMPLGVPLEIEAIAVYTRLLRELHERVSLD